MQISGTNAARSFGKSGIEATSVLRRTGGAQSFVLNRPAAASPRHTKPDHQSPDGFWRAQRRSIRLNTALIRPSWLKRSKDPKDAPSTPAITHKARTHRSARDRICSSAVEPTFSRMIKPASRAKQEHAPQCPTTRDDEGRILLMDADHARYPAFVAPHATDGTPTDRNGSYTGCRLCCKAPLTRPKDSGAGGREPPPRGMRCRVSLALHGADAAGPRPFWEKT